MDNLTLAAAQPRTHLSPRPSSLISDDAPATNIVPGNDPSDLKSDRIFIRTHAKEFAPLHSRYLPNFSSLPHAVPLQHRITESDLACVDELAEDLKTIHDPGLRKDLSTAKMVDTLIQSIKKLSSTLQRDLELHGVSMRLGEVQRSKNPMTARKVVAAREILKLVVAYIRKYRMEFDGLAA